MRSRKSKNIKKHFFKRCLERIGHYINTKDLIKKIQNQELEFISRTSNTRTLFKYHCEFNDKDYVVVYDKNKHDVVTIYDYKIKKQNLQKKPHV